MPYFNSVVGQLSSTKELRWTLVAVESLQSSQKHKGKYYRICDSTELYVVSPEVEFIMQVVFRTSDSSLHCIATDVCWSSKLTKFKINTHTYAMTTDFLNRMESSWVFLTVS